MMVFESMERDFTIKNMGLLLTLLRSKCLRNLESKFLIIHGKGIILVCLLMDKREAVKAIRLLVMGQILGLFQWFVKRFLNELIEHWQELIKEV